MHYTPCSWLWHISLKRDKLLTDHGNKKHSVFREESHLCSCEEELVNALTLQAYQTKYSLSHKRNTYTQPLSLFRLQTCMYKQHTHKHAHRHTHNALICSSLPGSLSHTHALTHAYAPRTRTHTHAHTHTQCMRMHADTKTHTQTAIPARSALNFSATLWSTHHHTSAAMICNITILLPVIIASMKNRKEAGGMKEEEKEDWRVERDRGREKQRER